MAFAVFVGGALGGTLSGSWAGALLFGGTTFLLSGLFSAVSYFQGAEMLMAQVGAVPVAQSDDPELSNVVEEMAIAAGIPVPKIYLIEDTALNAFATGRSPGHAAVAITRGLRARLSRDELQSVIAHEVGHIMNYDTRLMMLTAVTAGAVVLLCDMFWRGGMGPRRRSSSRENGAHPAILVLAVIFSVVAPIIAKLLQLSVSREREFLADATAVRLARHPEALISALRKLVTDTEVLEAANRATEHLYIVSPTQKLSAADVDSVWSTHPPIERRIARIAALAV